MAECFDVRKECALNPYERNDLLELFSFFQIKAPGVSSFQSICIDESKYNKIYVKLLKPNYIVINPNARLDTRLEKQKLKDFNAVKCVGMRFVVKKNNNRENELLCLLRHIRNSIAHGRVFNKTVGGVEYILFDDCKDDGSFTARIVTTKKELERWKKIILTYK